MYGTVARMRLIPGKEKEMEDFARQNTPNMPGFVFQHVYRMDADPNEAYLVVAFENKEAYQANANSPEQQQRYQQYRALLSAEPEWHDGEIIYSYPA